MAQDSTHYNQVYITEKLMATYLYHVRLNLMQVIVGIPCGVVTI